MGSRPQNPGTDSITHPGDNDHNQCHKCPRSLNNESGIRASDCQVQTISVMRSESWPYTRPKEIPKHFGDDYLNLTTTLGTAENTSP